MEKTAYKLQLANRTVYKPGGIGNALSTQA